LLFDDSSTSGGFASNDWILEANDSGSGGANYFAITDAGVGDPTNDSGTRVLRVDAGAPENTIRAYQNGNTSLGGAGVANTVSVGSPGFEGTISNVAPGTNDTDAVNRGQLDTVQTQVTTNTSNVATDTGNITTNTTDIATIQANGAASATAIKKNSVAINQNVSAINRNAGNISKNSRNIAGNSNNITRNAGDIAANRGEISNLYGELGSTRTEARRGIAASAALVELMPSAPGKTMVNIGLASFEGEAAAGMTAVHRMKVFENVIVNAGVALGGGEEVLYRVGGSFEF
jgi:autotransporter adhesin